jgi:hypothetical protein
VDNPDFVVLKFTAAEITEHEKNLMREETCLEIIPIFYLPIAVTRVKGYFLP